MFISVKSSEHLCADICRYAISHNNRQSSKYWEKDHYNEGHGITVTLEGTLTTTGLNGFILIWIFSLDVWMWIPIHHALSCLLPMPVWTGVRLQPALIMHLLLPIWNSNWVAAWLKSEGGLFREFCFKGELKPKLKWQYKYISQNISFQPKVFKSLLSSCYFQRKCLMEIWDRTQNIEDWLKWLVEIPVFDNSDPQVFLSDVREQKTSWSCLK